MGKREKKVIEQEKPQKKQKLEVKEEIQEKEPKEKVKKNKIQNKQKVVPEVVKEEVEETKEESADEEEIKGEEIKEQTKKNKIDPRPKDREKKGPELEIHAGLVYLEKFHKKDGWKFSKNDQTWIIENILNRRMIPVEYFKYALDYFQDLKGAARDRLTDICSKAKSAQEQKEKDALSDNEEDSALTEALNENNIYKRASTLLDILKKEE